VGTAAAWVVVLAVFLAAWLVPSVLTAAGAVRRGQRRGLALLTGLFFPVSWLVWYVVDERRRGGGLFLRGRSQEPEWRDR